MSQAKTLTSTELKRVLKYVSAKNHAERNRVMLLMGYWSGMRVGEIAALKVSDVLANDGTIKNEVHLKANQTKGNKGRAVIISTKLAIEIEKYLNFIYGTNSLIAITYSDTDRTLFYTQKRNGFDANTLCATIHNLYKEIGMHGASSHSGRRTFITNLASKGVGVRVLMSLAGHKHLSTVQRYIDVNDDMKRSAVELL